jgi:predicted ATPase
MPVILTPDQRLRVFIAALTPELADERAAAERSVGALRLSPVAPEFPDDEAGLRHFHDSYIDQSHIFVGIYGSRYGPVGRTERSDIEVALLRAEGRPRLLYARKAGERDRRLEEMLERAVRSGIMVRPFADPEELRRLLEDDLAHLLSERFERARRAGARALDASSSRQAALPIPPTPLVGRDKEAREVADTLGADEVRIVTMSGPGGIGKTRLAIEVAARLAPSFDDGVRFVPLATVEGAEGVGPALFAAFGLKESASRPPSELLSDYLRTRSILIVLDSFERAAAAGPMIGELLSGAPGIKFLVTSRSVLNIRGENEYPVPPMSVPDPARRQPQGAEESDAVRLFVETARAANPAFELTEDNANDVAEICRRLDGLPLAIELAAARVRLLPVGSLLERLEDRFRLLTSGLRDAPDRQRTLWDTITWDYDLLTAEEQKLFVRLGVFVGSFTLAGAEAVASAPVSDEVDVLDLLDSLVGKSLVRAEAAELNEPRFSMLESIREYARERLLPNEEHPAVFGAHARFYVDLARKAHDALRGPEHGAWQRRIVEEHDNVRAALRWADEHDHEAESLLCTHLWEYWSTTGHLLEGLGWIEGALGHASEPSLLRAELLEAGGVLARALGVPVLARGLTEQCLELRRELGDRAGMAAALKDVGNLAFDTGDFDSARGHYEQALELWKEVDDKRGVAQALNNLGVVARMQDDPRRAIDYYEESRDVFHALGDDEGIARSLMNQGAATLEAGDPVRAAELCRSSLSIWAELGNRWDITDCLEDLAASLTATGEAAAGARLLGAAEALREETGTPLAPAERRIYDGRVAEARRRLDEATFTEEWSRGRALTLEEAIAVALANDDARVPDSPR